MEQNGNNRYTILPYPADIGCLLPTKNESPGRRCGPQASDEAVKPHVAVCEPLCAVIAGGATCVPPRGHKPDLGHYFAAEEDRLFRAFATIPKQSAEDEKRRG